MSSINERSSVIKKFLSVVVALTVLLLAGLTLLSAQDNDWRKKANESFRARVDDYFKNKVRSELPQKDPATKGNRTLPGESLTKNNRTPGENMMRSRERLEMLRAAGNTPQKINAILQDERMVAGSGSISGTLFQSDGTTPLGSSGNVTVYDTYGYEVSYEYYYSSDTAYTATGLPSGSFYVYARSYGDFVPEYYDDSFDWRAATLVNVTDGLETSGINFTLVKGKVIQGTVIDESTSQPLANRDARIYLYNADGREGYYWDYKSVRLSSAGHYTFSGVYPGRYKMSARVEGWTTEYHVNGTEWDNATIVTVGVAPDTVSNINFYLDPFVAFQDGYEQNNTHQTAFFISYGDSMHAQISPAEDVDFYSFSGQAGDTLTIDIDAYVLGSYLPSSLTLYDATGQSVLAANDGYFGYDATIKNFVLPYSGPYFIKLVNRYSGGGGDNYFYSLSLFEDGALPGAISGHIFKPDGTTPDTGYYIYLYDAQTGMGLTSTSDYNGTSYVFSGVPTGTYKLEYLSYYSDYADIWYDGVFTHDAATVVNVQGPDTTKNIDFIMNTGGVISGTVFKDGATPVDVTTSISVYDATTDYYVDSDYSYPSDSGKYRILGLQSGDYKIRTYSLDDTTYLLGNWYNGVYLQESATPVHVIEGQETVIHISLGQGGKIQGFLYEPDGVTRLGMDDMDGSLHIYDATTGAYVGYVYGTDVGAYRTDPLPATGHKVQFIQYYSNYPSVYSGGGTTFGDASSHTIAVQAGVTQDANITVDTAGGIISGMVYDFHGQPYTDYADIIAYDASGHIIQVTSVGWDPLTGQSLADGAYRVAGLKSGSCYLLLWYSDGDEAFLWYGGVTGKPDWKGGPEAVNLPAGLTAVTVSDPGETTNINFNITTGIADDRRNGIPEHFALDQNYPNPFNPVTTIRYQLPETEHVSLKVFNVLGQEVMTLVDEVQRAGYKSVDLNGARLPSGVYIYRMISGAFVTAKKLVLLK
jgi:hypothetical protein